MARRSLVGRMYDLEKLKARNAAAESANAGPVDLVHEDCRGCGAHSKDIHPSGVIAGRWRCYRCLVWQGDVAEEAVVG